MAALHSACPARIAARRCIKPIPHLLHFASTSPYNRALREINVYYSYTADLTPCSGGRSGFVRTFHPTFCPSASNLHSIAYHTSTKKIFSVKFTSKNKLASQVKFGLTGLFIKKIINS
ncbi:MAG: hypothetical protein LBO71_04790 [Prevotellaceae bacterium]|nr:hypothetical protein [Prevotellaceae bacterium]